MAIATIYVETGKFAPISEYPSRFNTSSGGLPFDLYDGRKDLGNCFPSDGARFKGRGFIQLTGRANYAKFGKILGINIVADPELANDPKVAALLLSEYLKAHENKIVQALGSKDLAKARKLVNGGSHGLETFSSSYLAGDMLLAA